MDVEVKWADGLTRRYTWERWASLQRYTLPGEVVSVTPIAVSWRDRPHAFQYDRESRDGWCVCGRMQHADIHNKEG